MMEGIQYGGGISGVSGMAALGAGLQGAFSQSQQQPPITYDMSSW